MSTSHLLYDRFERRQVPATPTLLHPTAVADRPPLPIHSVTDPTSTTLSMQSDVFGQSSRQSSTLKPFDIASEIPSRLPAMRDQPAANPPTPTVLNAPSPTPALRSTKVDAHTPLPPPIVLRKLVEIYFTHVNNQTCGFLHRPTFHP